MVKIGIIGCGWIVKKAYLPILAKMTDVEVSRIYDTNIQDAGEILNQYRIVDICENIDSFLSAPLDAVIIATPNNTHTYYTNLALQSGKHVLCEKPVAITRSDVELSVSIARENKKIFLPAYVNRFRKDVLKLSELVSLIGEIREVEVNWIRKSGIPRPGTWITNKAIAGGGVLIDIGTHVIDIGLKFISDKNIKCTQLIYGTSEEIEHEGAQWNINNDKQNIPFNVETWAKGEVVFGNQSVLKLNVSWTSNVSQDITGIKVIGNKGTVSMDSLFGFSNNFTRKNIVISHKLKNSKIETIVFPMKNTFALDAFSDMIRYFVDSIHGQPMNVLLSSDSIDVVDVIEKLYQLI